MKKYYLEDKLLVDEKQDQFGHKNLANVLYDLVVNQHNKDEQPSFNIGIFGKWGVGKSSIVELFKNRIEKNDLLANSTGKPFCDDKNKIAFIKIPVWKYTKQTESLRKKFIFRIGRELEMDLNDLKDDIYGAKEKIITPFLKEFKIDFSLFPINFTCISLIAISIIYIILVLSKIILPEAIIKSINNMIIPTPFILGIVEWIRKLIRSTQIKISFSRFDSLEQFEEKFIDTLESKKCKKVIFIDDLDRCPKDKVIETLETIKAFLEVYNCIFIIACDQDVIEDCINKTNSIYRRSKKHNGRQYLEKFFQYTLTIPPFIRQDMRLFAKQLLVEQSSELLSLLDIDDILYVLIHDGIKDPRKAIILINNFVSDYLVVKEREDDEDSKLNEGTITSNLTLLAKLTVLKHEFPDFYIELCRNNNVFLWIKQHIEGEYTNILDYQENSCLRALSYSENIALENEKMEDKEDKKNNKRVNIKLNKKIQKWLTAIYDEGDEDRYELFTFLNRTKSIGIEINDLRPFIYLTQDKSLYGIADDNIKRIFDSLRSGLPKPLNELLSENDSSENIAESILTLVEEFKGIELSNGVYVLSHCIEKFPKALLIRASEILIKKVIERLRDIRDFSYNGLLFACSVRKVNKDRIIGKLVDSLYIDNKEDYSKHETLLTSLYNYENLITAKSHIDKIKKYLVERTIEVEEEDDVEKQYDVNYYADSIIKLTNNHKAIIKFFSNEIPERIVDALVEEDKQLKDNEETDGFKKLKHSLLILVDSVFQSNKEKLFTALSLLMDTKKLFWFSFDLLKKNLEELTQYSAEKVTESLIRNISRVNKISDKNKILTLIVTIGERFSLEGLGIDDLEKEIVSLFDSSENEIIKSSFSILISLKEYFSKEIFEKLINNLIQRINPESSLETSNFIISLLVDEFNNLNDLNVKSLCDLSKKQIFNHVKILVDDIYNFWKTHLVKFKDLFETKYLEDYFSSPEFTNQLAVSLININIDAKLKMTKIINPLLEKVPSKIINNYLQLMISYIKQSHPGYVDFSVSNFYDLHSLIRQSSLLPIIKYHLYSKINDLIGDSWKKVTEILLFEKTNFNGDQKRRTITEIINQLPYNKDFCYNILISNWKYLKPDQKQRSVAKMINHVFKNDPEKENAVINKIHSDVLNLNANTKKEYIRELFLIYSKKTQNDFLMKLLSKLQILFNDHYKQHLTTTFIERIKESSDIIEKRKYLKAICIFRVNDFEKDKKVFILFNYLFSGKIENIKLAIEFYHQYYEKKLPYKKRSELLNLLQNIIDNEKDEIKRDAIKLCQDLGLTFKLKSLLSSFNKKKKKL